MLISWLFHSLHLFCLITSTIVFFYIYLPLLYFFTLGCSHTGVHFITVPLFWADLPYSPLYIGLDPPQHSMTLLVLTHLGGTQDWDTRIGKSSRFRIQRLGTPSKIYSIIIIILLFFSILNQYYIYTSLISPKNLFWPLLWLFLPFIIIYYFPVFYYFTFSNFFFFHLFFYYYFSFSCLFKSTCPTVQQPFLMRYYPIHFPKGSLEILYHRIRRFNFYVIILTVAALVIYT